MNTTLGPPRYRVGLPIGLGVRSRSRYERTNERTDGEVGYVTSKSSLTDTCARVQDFKISGFESRTLRAGSHTTTHEGARNE